MDNEVPYLFSHQTPETESKQAKKRKVIALIVLGAYFGVILLVWLFSATMTEWVSYLTPAVIAAAGLALIMFSKPIGNMRYKADIWFLTALLGRSKVEALYRMKFFWSRAFYIWMNRIVGMACLLASIYFIQR